MPRRFETKIKNEIVVLGLATMLVVGCAGSAPAPTATAAQSASPAPTVAPTATPAPTTTPSPSPTVASATPTPEAAGISVLMAGRAGTTGIELLYLPKAITVPAGDSTFV